MQKEIRSIYDTLYTDFEGTDFGEMKLRKALIFEAHERLVKHPKKSSKKIQYCWQKASNIVGLTALRLAFFMGYE